MASCFEKFIAKNMMVQSDFNYDSWFRNYDFFFLQKLWNAPLSVILYFLLACCVEATNTGVRSASDAGMIGM